MMLFIVDSIEKIIKKYTTNYVLENRSPDLSIGFICSIDNDESKELLLNEVDLTLPYGLSFSHTYENGKLDLNIKEVEICF